MKRTLAILSVGFFLVALVPQAEAVVGRGRSSSGSRGSRGWNTPRRHDPAPSRNYGSGSTYPGRSAPSSSPSFGGGMLRSFGAALAGGFLGSMLFRAFGGGGYGYGSAGGIGLLEIVLLGLLAFFAVRWFLARRRPAFAASTGAYPGGFPRAREDFSGAPEPLPPSEEMPDEVLAATEPDYDETRFKDARLDDFFRLQAAFGNRDLTSVRGKLAPEIAPALEEDVQDLKRRGQINRMDNIAVRAVTLEEAWREPGKVYATVGFEANVIDYVVDERTGEIVSGSRTDSTKFRENWTFVREIGFGKADASWRLSAIERLD